jgi:hypothetical protein
MRRRLLTEEITAIADDGSDIELVVDILGPSDVPDSKEATHDALSIFWGRDEDLSGIWIDLEAVKQLIEKAEGVKVSIASMENVDPKTLMRRRKK